MMQSKSAYNDENKFNETIKGNFKDSAVDVDGDVSARSASYDPAAPPRDQIVLVGDDPEDIFNPALLADLILSDEEDSEEPTSQEARQKVGQGGEHEAEDEGDTISYSMSDVLREMKFSEDEWKNVLSGIRLHFIKTGLFAQDIYTFLIHHPVKFYEIATASMGREEDEEVIAVLQRQHKDLASRLRLASKYPTLSELLFQVRLPKTRPNEAKQRYPILSDPLSHIIEEGGVG